MTSAAPTSHVLNILDIKNEASSKIPKPARDYYNDGANDMNTLRENEAAFNRYKLLPRVLRNVSEIDMSTTIWGSKVSFPFGFSPVAMQRLAHPDGEIATSKACAATDIPMGLSSWSTSSIEDVISHGNGNNPYAMQISMFKQSEVTARNLERAEKSGCKAVILTADAPLLGRRWNETRNDFQLPANLELPHLESSTGNLGFGTNVYDPNLAWDTSFAFIRARTKLPIWIKGIYTPEDVALAIDNGADGVIVSNHGGRQLDGVPAALDALRYCASVAKGQIPIGFDGGIRRGTDIFKAMALGADFCFAGRVSVWGLGFDGQRGVELAIDILKDEFWLCMGLAGCKNVREINAGHLAILKRDGMLAKL
ncbi:FMN-dependent dehydrogenase [Hortaea werneckii]|nr:FMN-dependent dehydrogenase [Hortaea werneckii]